MLIFEITLRHRERPSLHAHDNHEFFYCLEGEGSQHTEAGVAPCAAGELFFFPEGLLHIGSGARGRDCRAIVANVQESDLAAILAGDDDAGRLLASMKDRAWKGGNRIPMTAVTAAQIRTAFLGALGETAGRAPGRSLAVKTHLQNVFLALLRAGAAGGTTHGESLGRGNTEKRIKDFCKYLESNYMCQIDVEQAARMAGLSRSHFHATFRRVAGCALVAHLTKLRVAAALKLLADTDLTADEVARRCGFDSVSRFYAVLKKAADKSPRELRGEKSMAGRQTTRKSGIRQWAYWT